MQECRIAREGQNNKNEELTERTDEVEVTRWKERVEESRVCRKGRTGIRCQCACPIGFSEDEARGRFSC
jgi:hypothetical protein